MKALEILYVLNSEYEPDEDNSQVLQAIEELKALIANYEAQEIIIADLKREIEIMQEDLIGDDI